MAIVALTGDPCWGGYHAMEIDVGNNSISVDLIEQVGTGNAASDDDNASPLSDRPVVKAGFSKTLLKRVTNPLS